MSDPNSFLKICHDLLLPGAFIVAFNHDAESLQAKILRERSPIIDIGHYSLFSKATMGKIFRQNSFLPVKMFLPFNIVSLRHVLLLLPFFNRIKMKFLGSREGWWGRFLSRGLRVKLGNLCMVAVKK